MAEPHSAPERARFAATVVAQFLGIGVVLTTYFILYGPTWNRILTTTLCVFGLSLGLSLWYADLIYDMLKFFHFQVARPDRIPVDRLIMMLSLIDVVTLFLLMRWSIAPDPYLPMFLTMLTLAIILRASTWWIWTLTILVLVAYGSTLFLEHDPIPSAVKRIHVSWSHFIVLLFCLLVIAVEHSVMRHREE